MGGCCGGRCARLVVCTSVHEFAWVGSRPPPPLHAPARRCLPGLDAPPASPAEVAKYTTRTMLRTIPASVPGIHFLSGALRRGCAAQRGAVPRCGRPGCRLCLPPALPPHETHLSPRLPPARRASQPPAGPPHAPQAA